MNIDDNVLINIKLVKPQFKKKKTRHRSQRLSSKTNEIIRLINNLFVNKIKPYTEVDNYKNTCVVNFAVFIFYCFTVALQFRKKPL